MPRQRLTIGTFGDISTRMSPSGRYLARTRYRDWDGHARLVQASGTTAKAAERALKSKLADRDLFQPADTTLTPDSLFSDLVTYWLEDIDTEGRISRTTRNLYERNMRTLVSPVFDHLSLREIGVARCDKFIKQLSKISYSRAKQARVVLRLALELAVRHEVLPRNPMDHVSRLHREPHVPDALMAPEVNMIRAVIAQWESAADHTSGPKPDGQLGAIIEVMLGTSARIGEVLAVRRRDVDVTSPVPSAGSPQNRQVHSRCRHPNLHRRRGPPAARQGRESGPGRIAVPVPGRQAADNGECAPAIAAGTRGSGHQGSDPAHVPPHGRDRGQHQRQHRTRRRAARPHRHQDHGAALHPTQRTGEPGHRRAPRPGIREG
jgi:hypothetical protein